MKQCLLAVFLCTLGLAQTSNVPMKGQITQGVFIPPTPPEPPTPPSCVKSDITGYTQLTACQTPLTSGNYVLMNDVSANHTCFGTNASNVDLWLQGHTVTYGVSPVSQTFTDRQITRTTNHTDTLTSGVKGVWAPISTVIRVGNTAGATNYAYGTDYFISTDPNFNNTGHTYGDPRGLSWVAGRGPAAGAIYFVTFTTKEGAYGFGASNLDSNTTGFTQTPIVNALTNLSVHCGNLVASPNAGPFSAGALINGSVNMLVDEINWSSSNPNQFNQLGLLGETQNGIDVQNSTFSSASRWVTSRDNNHGAIMRTYSSNSITTPQPMNIHDNEILDGPHLGMFVNLPGAKVYNNVIKLRYKYTNGFAISAYNNTEVYGNTINCFDAADPDVGCRGIYGNGSVYVHDNVIKASSNNNNAEYAANGGCEIGIGPYGLQTEGNGDGIYTGNDVTVGGVNCAGTARRYTSSGIATDPQVGYGQNNVYRSFRRTTSVVDKAMGMSFHDSVFLPSSLAGGCHEADTRIEADTWNTGIIFQTTGIKLCRVTLVKGTLDAAYTAASHVSTGYHTFRFEGNGDMTLLDPVVQNGASLTDISTTVTGYTLNIRYTYTVNVKSAGLDLAGATVTMTSTNGTVYSATTDVAGNVAFELETSRATGNPAVVTSRNPFSLSIAKSGCTTVNASGITVTAPTTSNRTITCTLGADTLSAVNFGTTEHNVEANGFPNGYYPQTGVVDTPDAVDLIGVMRINNDQSNTFGHGTVNVKWMDINTANGVYNWGLLDYLVAQYNAQGYDIIYTFGYTPNWAHPTSCAVLTNCPCVSTDGPCWPPDDVLTTNTAWKNFVNTAVQRYKGSANGGTHGRIKYWGCWNEANSQTGGVGAFWYGGGGSTAQKQALGKMCADAYPLIKAVPGNSVITPDPQGTALEDFMLNYIDTVKDSGEACFGIGNNICADIIGIHTYVGSAQDTVESTLKTSMIDPLKAGLATRGLSGLEIWDTESSWGNGSGFTNMAKRPGWVARHTLTQMALGLKLSTWWSWTEEPLDSWLKTKPGSSPASTLCTTGIAYREVTEWLNGAKFTGALTNTGSEWSVTIQRADGTTALIIWNITNLATASGGSCTSFGTSTTANKTIPDQYTDYLKIDGTTVAITGAAGSRQVPVGINPIMLVIQ